METIYMKILKNIIITAAMLAAATAICFILRPLVPTDTHVPLIYVLAVLCVSRLTEGYFYGVLASMVAVVGVNYIFTYPYFQVDFTVTGYPLTFIVMLTVSISVSALTTQIKMQEQERLKAEKERIIIATFASNVNRVQQIINCAKKFGRKVAFSGRSMINYMKVANELGYIDIPENIIIDIDQIPQYTPQEIVLVTTGSQGEPMSALTRMAFSDHRKITVGTGDFIIISANPIPGNEKSVGNVVDELLKKGCRVVYESMYEVHVSGHACAEEHKIITSLVKPKYYIPVHGEQKHLRKSQDIAVSLGIDKKNTFIADIGTQLELNENFMKELPKVPAGKVFVDGFGVGDVGSIVLRDRKHLAQDGLIIIVASLDVYDGHVISGPDIVSRGFVYVRESEDLMKDIKSTALYVLDDCCDNNIHEWGVIKNRIKDDVSKVIFNKTGRSPMILPILMEV